MSRDESPAVSESDDDDWEFQMHICPICNEENMGKNMWHCSECRKLVCEGCGLITRGCSRGTDATKVCQLCHTQVFAGKRKYCTESQCTKCCNKSPRFKKTVEHKDAQVVEFQKQFNPSEWKKTHEPISYPGKYQGRFLADIFMSQDGFERGYIDWLIREGAKPRDPKYSDKQNKDFARAVKEATELKALVTHTKMVLRPMRKLKD
jgi:hypothetical protein